MEIRIDKIPQYENTSEYLTSRKYLKFQRYNIRFLKKVPKFKINCTNRKTASTNMGCEKVAQLEHPHDQRQSKRL